MALPPTFDRALLEKYDQPGPRYASYPTAPHFHEGFSANEYRQAAQASNEDPIPKALSVYVHVPFCERLCYYCACHKIVTHRRERAAEYLALLKREIALQAALFDGERSLTQLHLGGAWRASVAVTLNATIHNLLDKDFFRAVACCGCLVPSARAHSRSTGRS